ncbi:TPA: restriction endonuclease [Neisseria meningitidis]|uniref:hypothetical protein n=1 Tax=Neisseria meningitidis TaxID=487 RepID=UPI00026873C2|nr:hypothetical protein [Neisseria meningitidis]EJU76531.1 putative type II restriction endonuclease [Neisseria meningitidis NM2795]CCI72606.1 putative restriction enzyme [Neisseria meningitidis alpha704]
MKEFVQEILIQYYPDNYSYIYNKSPLLQYLDSKMGAIYGNSKTRRSLANIYAIYSLLHFYAESKFINKPEEYKKFYGFEYNKLFYFYRSLYGGDKLQNHALNSRVNGEFKNKFNEELIIINNGKYLINIKYLYVDNFDLCQVSIDIIEKYIYLLKCKDSFLVETIENLFESHDISEKKRQISILLNEKSEARIFEIISYAILKNHYKNISVFFGYSRDSLQEEFLKLYKTGRTNANDGGIDFVMKPLGRFFQVTEVNNFDKYLLDIDKVLHFPITFVVKTETSKDQVNSELIEYINNKSNGMEVIINRYKNAIEEIITINELNDWLNELCNCDIDKLLKDIDLYYKLELNLLANDE